MKFFLIAILIMTLSDFLNAGDTNVKFPNTTVTSIHLCSDYVWVEEEFEEFQRVCISVNSDSGDEFSATYWRECMPGDGDCPASPFENKRTWCYLDNRPWGEFVDVLNTNRIIISIPKDTECLYPQGNPQGAELIAITNGEHVVKTEFEKTEIRYLDEGRQCWSKGRGGSEELRLADVIAVIDGWELMTRTHIRKEHVDRVANHCSN